jgi:hypothetical protein
MGISTERGTLTFMAIPNFTLKCDIFGHRCNIINQDYENKFKKIVYLIGFHGNNEIKSQFLHLNKRVQ